MGVRCRVPGRWRAEGVNTIIGKKVALKPITYDDTENIIRWRNSDFVRNQFLYRELFTRESHEGWLRDKVETGKAVQFIIIERSSGLEIGSAYLRDIGLDRRVAANECGISRCELNNV